ncbi:A/G-specific adenine glycosylase [Paenalkalicoccus suaedae]|uniref:A/G-specific adenine glycosylase n=1 Tax=Paenalkalicoccus suaedae TaxID=2592382 RepID=UPI003D317525
MQPFDKYEYEHDLLEWYDREKRDLPWRRERDPYRIWVSEIMLQQTKVDTVIPYYERFMSQFPTVDALADADEEQVLKAWEGLGYYSRARNLHAAVKEVQSAYGGVVPNSEEEIHKLRGVGPYTAGAILSIAYNIPAPAVDGNVMRVLSRIFAIYDDIAKPATRKRFETIIREIISTSRASDYNQALMELGAMICTPTKPACLLCPVQAHCQAREQGVQELLPVKAKKKKPKSVTLQAYVLITEDGRFIVEKRPETGLLANLWQFPTALDGETMEKFLENYGVDIIKSENTQRVRHVFSHIIWEMDVYRVQISGQPKLMDRQELVTLEEISEKAFPVSHQKIIKETLKGEG